MRPRPAEVAPPASPENAVTAETRDLPTDATAGSVSRRLAIVTRWLHIYGSMFGLIALLFFGVTGLTLNHPDWTLGSVRRQEELTGTLELGWIRAGLPDERVARLEIVESLRRRHNVTGAVEEFRLDEREALVAFKGPGCSADAFIDRDTGAYRLTRVREGWVALINDLHKGRHTGAAWAWAIDVSAALTVLISASGLILLLYLRRRRLVGLVTGLIGGAILLAVGYWLIP